MIQTAIPCSVMRGGTSKGLVFDGRDLPLDRAERDAVLLAAMGSPDPREIDGMGGAHPRRRRAGRGARAGAGGLVLRPELQLARSQGRGGEGRRRSRRPVRGGGAHVADRSASPVTGLRGRRVTSCMITTGWGGAGDAGIAPRVYSWSDGVPDARAQRMRRLDPVPRHDDLRRGDRREGCRLSARHLTRALDASLRRLGVECLDLYQVHAFDPWTPMDETLRALDGFARAGKIHYYGLSNSTAWQLTKAVHLARQLGLAEPVTLQPQYNLLVREIEWEIVPAVEDAGLGLLPWGPLGGGWLSGKYRRDERPSGDTRLGDDPAGRDRRLAGPR